MCDSLYEYATDNEVNDDAFYDSKMMRIQMNKNIERAIINGISFQFYESLQRLLAAKVKISSALDSV